MKQSLLCRKKLWRLLVQEKRKLSQNWRGTFNIHTAGGGDLGLGCRDAPALSWVPSPVLLEGFGIGMDLLACTICSGFWQDPSLGNSGLRGWKAPWSLLSRPSHCLRAGSSSWDETTVTSAVSPRAGPCQHFTPWLLTGG